MVAHVLVVNLHGGSPSDMIHKMMTLPNLARLAARSTFFPQLYCTNVAAEDALHDLVATGEPGSRYDGERTTAADAADEGCCRTVFQLFRRHGYQTVLFGDMDIGSEGHARAEIGLGELGPEEVHAGNADEGVLAGAIDLVERRLALQTARCFCMVNLACCKLLGGEGARLGGTGEGDSRARAWAILRNFDGALGRILDGLEQAGLYDSALVAILCDHPSALERPHPAPRPAPSNACTRGFLLIKYPHQTSPVTHPFPTSASTVMPMVTQACGVAHHWPRSRLGSARCCTLGFRASAASRSELLAREAFFSRLVTCVRERWYAVAAWFSLAEMARASGVKHSEPDPLLDHAGPWRNPLAKEGSLRDSDRTVTVYELAEDADELHNLANDESFLQSPLADELAHAFSEALRGSHCSSLLRAARAARKMPGPDAVPRGRDASTQTEGLTCLVRVALPEHLSEVVVRAVDCHTGHMTVFVPETAALEEWPDWCPCCVLGAHSPADLVAMASDEAAPWVRDVCFNTDWRAHSAQRGTVRLNAAEISLASFRRIVGDHCEVVTYSAYSVGEESLAEALALAAKTRCCAPDTESGHTALLGGRNSAVVRNCATVDAESGDLEVAQSYAPDAFGDEGKTEPSSVPSPPAPARGGKRMHQPAVRNGHTRGKAMSLEQLRLNKVR